MDSLFVVCFIVLTCMVWILQGWFAFVGYLDVLSLVIGVGCFCFLWVLGCLFGGVFCFVVFVLWFVGWLGVGLWFDCLWCLLLFLGLVLFYYGI